MPSRRAGSPLNEGRGVNPGDPRPSSRSSGWARAALNEGRGVNPGDPLTTTVFPSMASGVAQRRPGREPRRPPAPAAIASADALRSTKAGA